MQHDRNARRGGAARATAASFPDDDPNSPSSSNGESSHIARRRASSAPAHEVTLADLEILDPNAPSPRTPRWAPPPLFARFRGKIIARSAEPARFPESSPVSVTSPVSGTRKRSPPPPLPELTERPAKRRSRTPLLAAVAAGLLVSSGVAFAVMARAPASVSAASVTTTTPAAAPAPKSESPTSTIPVVAVTNLPRAPVGTVIGAQGHRLWIDGVLAQGWQAPVKCGSHVVQVGSAGTPKTVEVPCGDEIVVQP
jgi:hypothetical protein